MEALKQLRSNVPGGGLCLHTLSAHGLYVHALPGRLRLELPGLLENPLLAQKLELSLARILGVHRVRASSATGRVLLEYAEPLDGEELLHRLQDLGHLSGCGCKTDRFASPNTLVDMALENAVKIGLKLTLGI